MKKQQKEEQKNQMKEKNRYGIKLYVLIVFAA